MKNGYVLLWRASLDSPVWADAKLWRLWTWCLLRASWKARTVLLGRGPVRLSPGGLACTLAEAAAGTGLTQKEVRTCLALGKKLGCLAVQGTARGMRIDIVNWQEYQHPGGAPGGASGQGRGTAGARGRAESGQGPGAPSLEEEHRKAREGTDDTPGAGGRDADCERFLAGYPRRTGLDAARRAWAELGPELPPVDALLAAVERQARQPGWQREGGRYIPGPARWLLGRRWQDEAGAPGAASGVDRWLRAGGEPGP